MRQVLELLIVKVAIGLASSEESRYMFQIDQPYSCSHVIHVEAEAPLCNVGLHPEVVPCTRASVAVDPKPADQLPTRIEPLVGADEQTATYRREVFDGLRREDAKVARAADGTALVRCAERVRAILDHHRLEVEPVGGGVMSRVMRRVSGG